MPFPKTRDELVAARYRFSEHARCRGVTCGREIEWWRTNNDKPMPFDLMPEGDSPAVPHWGTCPDRDDFKRKR